MPITLPSGIFNTGRDCQVIIQHSFAAGGVLRLPNVTGFQAAQMTANVTVDRLDGVQLFAHLPKGWNGSFNSDRGSNDADNLFVTIEDAWFRLGQYVQATIFQIIQEAGGGQSTYQFQSASITFTDPGSWRGDATVRQSLSFQAARRIPM